MLTYQSFSELLNDLDSLPDHGIEDSKRHLARIHSLIEPVEDRWGALYELLVDIYLVFCPWHMGVPKSKWVDQDIEHSDLSIVEVLLASEELLSSSEWFGCDSKCWLGIVAAERIGNGLLMKKAIDAAEATQEDNALQFERAKHTTLLVGFWASVEALTAAETIRRLETRKTQDQRRSAKSGALARNKLYYEAHNAFLAYYFDNRKLSRSEAARRFYHELQQWPEEKRPAYVDDQSAVRALTESLRRRNI